MNCNPIWRPWKKLGLAARLIILSGLVLSLGGATLLYVTVASEVANAHADFAEEMVGELQSLEALLSEQLVVGDYATIQQVLDVRVQARDVGEISLTDARGHRVTGVSRPPAARAPAWFSRWVALPSVQGKRDVTVGGQHYGQIVVRFTEVPTINRIWRLVQVQFVILLAGLLIFVGLTAVLMRCGLAPLRDLIHHAGEFGRGNYSTRIPSGGIPEMQVAIQAFNEMAGRIEGLLASLREREAQLKEFNETLELRVAEEVAKNRDKDHLLIRQSRLAAMGEMIGNIAHQWRQPLNALGLLLDNIKDAYDYEELDGDYLEREVTTGRRLIEKMSSTIDDFRNFFRPDRKRVLFGLNQSVREAIAMVEASFRNRNIIVDWQEGEDVTVSGFPGEYSQVLLNILGNARDAIQNHRVVSGKVEIRLLRDNGSATLRVRDNGGGVPEEIREKIFDPYFTTREKGTGIGLYMSKMIVENMGGEIEVRNTAEGAEFDVIVPVSSATTPVE